MFFDFLRGAFWVRFFSAAVLVPIVLAAVVAGHVFFVFLVGCCAVVMVMEWVILCGHSGHRESTSRGRLNRHFHNPPALILLAVVLAGIVGLLFSQIAMTIVLAVVSVPMVACVGGGQKQVDGQKGSWLLAAGAAYILIPCAALVWMRLSVENGFSVVIWVLAVVWATDIGAYVVGRTLGGARLAPVISPNKTWSGLIGGVIAAAASGVLLGDVLALSPPAFLLALAGAGLAVIAQGGDLLESAIKRRRKVKDSGWLIPGHGGILDRVDGLLTAAPVAALTVMLWESFS